MNGACGFLRRSLRSTVATTASPAASSAAIAWASSAVVGSALSPFQRQIRASNGGGSAARQIASTDQYSSGLNAAISASRSHTRADRDRLDPAGGQPALDLVPQDRADLVADDAVEDPARLLRVGLVHVDLARCR